MNIFNRLFSQSLVVAMVLASLVLVPVMAFGKSDHDDEDRVKTRASIAHEARVLGSPIEIIINDNGRTLVRGAKVTAISGSTISAVSELGSTTLSWTVNTNSGTEFTQRGRGDASLATIAVSDIISFQGQLNTSASTLTINAKVVKDWTKKEKPIPPPMVQDIFQGTLQSIASTTTLPTTLTLRIGGVDHTVTVSSSTQILSLNWTPTTLATFVVGDIVRVFGTPTATTTLNAIVVRNASR